MKPIQKWLWIVLGLMVLVAAVVWRLQLFADEPVYHGKTVTEWLDGMALFDGPRHADEEGWNYNLPKSPDAIQNDPALQALLTLGSNAVPTLEKRLTEAPERSPNSSLSGVEDFAKLKWAQMSGSGPASPGTAPLNFSNIQEARKMAASLALLALGTNHNGGALRLIELTAAAPATPYGDDKIPFLDSFGLASAGLPERHDEIVAGILAGLTHTNASCQRLAIMAARTLPAAFPAWRKPLLTLAQDPELGVRESALLALAVLGPTDSETIALCEKTLQDRTNPPQFRSFAALGLGLAEARAGNALPLLREVLTETNIPKGSALQKQAAKAIDLIEKAEANAGSR